MTTPRKPPKPHLPWEPLGRMLAVYCVDRDACGTSAHRIGRVIGVNARRVETFKRQGWVTVDMAERICDRIARNPHEIWDEYGAIADLPIEDANDRRNALRRARRTGAAA